MSERVTLTLRQAHAGRVGADIVAPDRLATLSNAEIGALPLWLAPAGTDDRARPRRSIPLGELFSIQGDRAAVVHVAGDLRAVDGLGAHMGSGTLTIDGDSGRDVGRQMRGGTIDALGSVGTDAGLAMAGGSISITGDAGERLGGTLPGASRGMTGGEIFVRGSAAPGAANAVRRGLIVIGGDAVDAGRAMIAGTLVVVGRINGTVGDWNKRGSIVTIGGATVPPTYRYACTYRPAYFGVLSRYLRSRAIPVDDRLTTGWFARYCGDLSQLGRGELLIWAVPASP
jgi:formylmethanofuran dehydrogenase subunit C